jgi:signal transduction histidine kinase
MESRVEATGEWRRDPPDARARRTDALVALVLLVGALVSVWLYARTGIYKQAAPPWQCVSWAVLVTLPLALRRRYPIPVTIVISAVFVAGQQLHVPELLFSNIALFLAFYSIGAWSANRMAAMLVRAGIIAAIFIWLFTSLILGAGGSTTLSTAGALSPYLAYGLISILTNMLYFGGAYFFGETAFRSARQRATLEARTDELAEEREHSAAQAVALDRVRIARELHDVVAHHVSVMGVQAGAARRVLASDPNEATNALASIESSARSAVDEMRMLLGALRADDPADNPADFPADDPARSTSTRGLGQLHTLVAEAAAAGLSVRVSTIGDSRPVPGTIELSAYRIVQEALTNTRKHGGADVQAEVRLRYETDTLEVEVSDNGRGAPARETPGRRGLGPIGMRERVAAVGGVIELGSKSRGGYLVRARFPLPVNSARAQEQTS